MDDDKCGAKTKKKTLCNNPKGFSTDHPGYGRCKFHGGNNPSGKTSAARDEGRALMASYGSPVEIHPQDALLEEVYRTNGHVLWLSREIAKWNSTDGEFQDATGEPTASPILGDIEGLTTKLGLTEAQQQWMTLYVKEREHLARVSKLALDAGVAQRAIQIAEAQSDRLVWVIEAFIRQLGLTEEQRIRVPDIVPPLLRQITSERMDRALPYGKDVHRG